LTKIKSAKNYVFVFLCTGILFGPGAYAHSPSHDLLGDTNSQAMAELNQMRANYGLPPVRADRHLAERCAAWANQMNSTATLQHDPSVYGTEERENIAGAWGYNMSVTESMQLWEQSPPHAASMFDEGFPTAVFGGYAQVGGFSCLRLCPNVVRLVSGPCS
jgi:uncharacterized protein YkwD